jgi:hypothetical protein
MVSQLDGTDARAAAMPWVGSTIRPERMVGGTCDPPFPIHPGLAESLAAAHVARPHERDATVAHVLGTCAGYAYAETDTVSTMMVRLGLEGHACVRIAQRVDAMLIDSTAYLVQSRCGRVVIVCYRGTQPTSLTNWLGDAEVGSPASTLSLADGATRVRVHAGFHRNLRATFADVVRALAAAAEGRSLADPDQAVEHGLEALYVTGHSLGGAMALLFALMISGSSQHRAVASRLRAVYTFGQPMALDASPGLIPGLESRVFRHVMPRDPVPALPPAKYGRFKHIGQEYRYVEGEWQRAYSAVEQLAHVWEIPRSILSWLAPEGWPASSPWSVGEHAPHHYIAALRSGEQVTEFGD